VAFGDTIIRSEGRTPLVRRMIQSHLEHGSTCTLAVERVPPEELYRFGVVAPDPACDPDAVPEFRIVGLVEKPDRDSAPSTFAIAPRYVFERALFDGIRRTVPGRGGQLWLADSIDILIKIGHPVRALKLTSGEQRYDIGTFESYFKAFIDFAVSDEKYGYLIRQYLIWKTEHSSRTLSWL